MSAQGRVRELGEPEKIRRTLPPTARLIATKSLEAFHKVDFYRRFRAIIVTELSIHLPDSDRL